LAKIKEELREEAVFQMQSGAGVKTKPKKNSEVMPRVYVFQPDKSIKKG
jgi:hypothetical protein